MTIGSDTDGPDRTTAALRERKGPGVLRRRTFLAGVTALVVFRTLPAAAQTPSGYGRGYTGGY